MSNKRKKYSTQEKVRLLRLHLIEKEPVSFICCEGCVSVFFAFLYYTRYCFLAIYVKSNILVHKSLL